MQLSGWIIIIFIYMSIGALSACGFIALTQKLFKTNHERIVYGLLLIIIGLFYLSFVMYFNASESVWALESHVILLVAVLGLAGTVRSELLITGYMLHGLWDLLHELFQHYNVAIPHLDQLTPIPLAYGVFCFTFDTISAVYFFYRRKRW